jgi:hypothetical protein
MMNNMLYSLKNSVEGGQHEQMISDIATQISMQYFENLAASSQQVIASPSLTYLKVLTSGNEAALFASESKSKFIRGKYALVCRAWR